MQCLLLHCWKTNPASAIPISSYAKGPLFMCQGSDVASKAEGEKDLHSLRILSPSPLLKVTLWPRATNDSGTGKQRLLEETHQLCMELPRFINRGSYQVWIKLSEVLLFWEENDLTSRTKTIVREKKTDKLHLSVEEICKECLRSPWKVVGFPQITYFLSDYQRLCKQLPKLIKLQKNIQCYHVWWMCILARNGHQRALIQLNNCFFA